MEALTYERVREEIAPLDNYSRRPLGPSAYPQFTSTEGGSLVVRFPKDPSDDRPVAEREYDDVVVTRELWDAIGKDIGMGKRYADRTPPRLLLPNLNYWYADPDAPKDEVSLLVREGANGNTLGLDILKPGRFPIKASALLDIVHGSIADKGGTPSYTYFNRDGIKECTIACVQPQAAHEVTASRQVGDILRAGVMVNFSPIGLRPVMVRSYVDRLICTNGMSITDTLDAWSAPGGEGSNDPFEWIPGAIDAAWEGTAAMFQAADRMAATEVPEDAVETLVNDAFDYHRIPGGLRARVLARLANQNVTNGWDIQNAITYAATHDEAIKDDRQRIRLMSFGGDVSSHFDRCESCSHLITR